MHHKKYFPSVEEEAMSIVEAIGSKTSWTIILLCNYSILIMHLNDFDYSCFIHYANHFIAEEECGILATLYKWPYRWQP